MSGFESWSPSEVADFVKSNGFPSESALFRENEISGDLLPLITDDHLKDMGITAIGPRVLIYKLIRDAVGVPVSRPAPARAAAPRAEPESYSVPSNAAVRRSDDGARSPKPSTPAKKKKPEPQYDAENVPKYKRDHDKMVESIRAARRYAKYQKAVEEGRAVGPPPDLPPIEEPEGLVQCPNCGRKFGEEAAKRHIPVCERMNAKKGLPRGGRW